LLVPVVEYRYTACGLFSPKNQEGSEEQRFRTRRIWTRQENTKRKTDFLILTQTSPVRTAFFAFTHGDKPFLDPNRKGCPQAV